MDAFCTMSCFSFKWPAPTRHQRSDNNHQQHHIHEHAGHPPDYQQQNGKQHPEKQPAHHGYLPLVPSTRLRFFSRTVEAVSSISSPESVLATTSVLVQGTFTFESLNQPDSVTAFFSSYTVFPFGSLSSTCYPFMSIMVRPLPSWLTASKNLFDRSGAETQRKASYSPVVTLARERTRRIPKLVLGVRIRVSPEIILF